MNSAENVPLAPHTTLRVGGKAAFFVEAETTQDIIDAVALAQEHSMPWMCLGGGSNILMSDDGFAGVVIKIGLKGIDIIDEDDSFVVVRFGAGESWDACVAWAVDHGYWGIENLSGIPGTVGATPIQNVGAYGTEVADCIVHVDVFDAHTLRIESLEHAACAFAYRDSVFKHKTTTSYIVTAVVFRLFKKSSANITYKDLALHFANTDHATISLRDIRNAVLHIRSQKFPDLSRVGTAGSFFKNPIVSEAEAERLRTVFPNVPLYPYTQHNETTIQYKTSAAWLLDNACGLKGFRQGNVQLFERQPLVLVAHTGATAREIDMFAKHVQQKVFDVTGVMLEREVRDV